MSSSSSVDIICFALSRWDSPISSPSLSLAKELAKNHRVFYIDHPFSWKDVIAEFNSKQVKARRSAWLGFAGFSNKQPYQQDELSPNLIFVTPPLTLPVNFLPEGKLYELLSTMNQKLMEKFLGRIIRDHNIREYVFINFFDPFFYTRMSSTYSSRFFQTPVQTGNSYTTSQSALSMSYPAPRLFVYQSMDEISEVSYTAKHGVRLERELVKKADLTICTSRALTAKYEGVGRRVEYFPNAVDFELFKKAYFQSLPKPVGLQKIQNLKTNQHSQTNQGSRTNQQKGQSSQINQGSETNQLSKTNHRSEVNMPSRIIGFTGSVDYRTDFDLLRKAAERYPHVNFFFLGPLITVEHQRYGLDTLPNIVFHPPRNLSDLPGFLQHLDVLIIPYKINELTKAIYPLKINEYLAAGKPVVATGFSEDIRSFGDLIYVADNEEQFMEGISKALQENDDNLRRRRVECASQNSWKHRADQLFSLLSSME